MSDTDGEQFGGYRVEHHAPDGTTRLLAETTMLTIAQNACRLWHRRLARGGSIGRVVVLKGGTGEIVMDIGLESTPV